MTPDDIRSLLAADPFEKFTLNLADGSAFEVGDPGQVSFTPSGGALVHDAKGRRTFIALAHVATVGFAPSGGDPYFLKAGRSRPHPTNPLGET